MEKIVNLLLYSHSVSFLCGFSQHFECFSWWCCKAGKKKHNSCAQHAEYFVWGQYDF